MDGEPFTITRRPLSDVQVHVLFELAFCHVPRKACLILNIFLETLIEGSVSIHKLFREKNKKLEKVLGKKNVLDAR